MHHQNMFLQIIQTFDLFITEGTLGSTRVFMHVDDVTFTVPFSFAQYATQGALEPANHFSFLWEESLKQGTCAACLRVKLYFCL